MTRFIKSARKDRGRSITRRGFKGAYTAIIQDQLFCVNWSTDCGKINGFVTLVNKTVEYNIVITGLHIH